MRGGRRQSEGLLRWIITQSDSWRHWARAAPVAPLGINFYFSRDVGLELEEGAYGYLCTNLASPQIRDPSLPIASDVFHPASFLSNRTAMALL